MNQQKQQQKTISIRMTAARRCGISASCSLLLALILVLDPISTTQTVLAFSPPSTLHSKTLSKHSSNGIIGSPAHTHTRHATNHHNSNSASTTKLNMMSLPSHKSITSFLAPPLLLSNIHLTLSALTATITGGLFAGSLHAIAGPDHLAALLPRCCGLPWYKAARVGAVWGLGHGVSATLLGMVGFALKRGVSLFGFSATGSDSFDMLHHAGSFMELAIGISLIVIGLVGIKEAREWKAEDVTTTVKSLSSAAAPDSVDISNSSSPSTAKSAVLFNGILHGFSWDGAPSLAPAVAIATWRGSLTFLISYALGTMGAMTVATTLIGEGTRKASKKLDRPDLPRDLSVGSSFLALLVGVVWCVLALR